MNADKMFTVKLTLEWEIEAEDKVEATRIAERLADSVKTAEKGEEEPDSSDLEVDHAYWSSADMD